MRSNPILLFLESEGFSPKAAEDLGAVFELAMTGTDVPERVRGLFVRLGNYIDATVLDAYPNLAFIASPTTGLNHLDQAEIARRGIEVLSLKGEVDFLQSITATAEFTWGLVLSLTRRIPQAQADVAAGHWNRDGFRGIDLSGRTIGIVGYGRLGQIVEAYAHTFRMHILVHDQKDIAPKYGKSVQLDELLSASDIVTLHVDVNPGSVGLFDAARFAQIKPGCLFINTSRGEIVDEAALVAAVKDGIVQAAAVDVIQDEQIGRGSSPLLAYARKAGDRLLITPHLAGASLDSMHKTEEFIANKILAGLSCD